MKHIYFVLMLFGFVTNNTFAYRDIKLYPLVVKDKYSMRVMSNFKQKKPGHPDDNNPLDPPLPLLNSIYLGQPVQDKFLNQLWGIFKVGAPQSWKQNQGSRTIRVAILDSGIDYRHPDLVDNLWRNPNPDRYKKDFIGWDFVDNDNLPYDGLGHGTHVAGIIGATGKNGIGVSGVAPQVSLMILRFMGNEGFGLTSNAIKAIDYAIKNKADIINASWGGEDTKENNQGLEDAIERAKKAGILFVAAAGNENMNNDETASYPANSRHENVISVASLDEQSQIASYSNLGARTVHIAAPGSMILSTVLGGNYDQMNGTSMAAPFVSGLAALVMAQDPNIDVLQLKSVLLRTGVPILSRDEKPLQRQLSIFAPRALQAVSLRNH